METVLTLVTARTQGGQLAQLGRVIAQKWVTIYRNRPIYGYVTCLTTDSMWQRIVSLVRTRETSIKDRFRDRFSTSAEVPVSGRDVRRKTGEWGV